MSMQAAGQAAVNAVDAKLPEWLCQIFEVLL